MLSDARIAARRRGRAPGEPRARVAQCRRPRRPRLRPGLAVQDRDEPVPDFARADSRRELPVEVLPGTPDTEIAGSRTCPARSPETTYLARESVEIAYVAALQRLTALQRAVLILREVLGFSAAEVAGQLDTSTASVNSALQRARKVIDTSGASQQSVLHDLGPDAVGEIVTRWLNAWQAGDIDAIVAMLTDEPGSRCLRCTSGTTGPMPSGCSSPLVVLLVSGRCAARGPAWTDPRCGSARWESPPTGLRRWACRRPRSCRTTLSSTRLTASSSSASSSSACFWTLWSSSRPIVSLASSDGCCSADEARVRSPPGRRR